MLYAAIDIHKPTKTGQPQLHSASLDHLVMRETRDGVLLKLSKRRGVAVLIVDGNRLEVRRSAPYAFFISEAKLRNTGMQHWIDIRDGRSGSFFYSDTSGLAFRQTAASTQRP